MNPLVGLPLALLTLAMVSYPLLRKNDGIGEWEEPGSLAVEAPDDLERDSIFAALTELEFDYRMNKISESDYSQLRSKLMKRAVDAIKRDDAENVGERA